MNTTDIAVVDNTQNVVATRSVLDISPAEFSAALDRRSANRKSLIDWIRQSLVDGVDFGAVPQRNGKMSKPSLRKSGAEKICGMLGVMPTFPSIGRYEQLADENRLPDHFIVKCVLLNGDGIMVAEGTGARSLTQDGGDLNKCIKMLSKSAHIDATLRMAGLSEILTQDLEDMPKFASDGDTSETSRPANPPAQQTAPPSQDRKYTATHDTGPAPTPGSHRRGYASDKQVKLINYRADLAKIPMLEVLQAFRIPDINSIPFAAVNDILAWVAERTDAE